MLEFQNKKKIRKVLYSFTTLILLSIVFIVLLKAVWSVYKKERISSGNLEKEKLESLKLKERDKGLTDSILYLNTEEGIENEIRTKFRAVKEGESVAVIVDEQATRTPVTATSTNGFWYRLFH